MISFLDDGDGSGLRKPLVSEIGPPYRAYLGTDTQGGLGNNIYGIGLTNSGSSGAPLLDQGSGKVCAVSNYAYETDSTLVGFNSLPDNDFMKQQIEEFLQEQISGLK